MAKLRSLVVGLTITAMIYGGFFGLYWLFVFLDKFFTPNQILGGTIFVGLTWLFSVLWYAYREI